jgi:hypothetical protein
MHQDRQVLPTHASALGCWSSMVATSLILDNAKLAHA